MNAKWTTILAIVLIAGACKPKQSGERTADKSEFHLIGRQDKRMGKIIVAMGDRRGVLLLGGNHIFGNGEKIAGAGWRIKVLRLEPTYQETSVEIDPGQQVFLNDQGQSEVIDGAFDLSGQEPVWTGMHPELGPLITSALKSKIIAQQAGASDSDKPSN